MGMLRHLERAERQKQQQKAMVQAAPTFTPASIEAGFTAIATNEDRLVIERPIGDKRQHCRILFQQGTNEAQRLDMTGRIAQALGLPLFEGRIGYSNLLTQVIEPLAKVSGPITLFDLQ